MRMPLSYQSFIAKLVALAITLTPAIPALAKPDLAQKVGTTVADTGSPDYRFSDLRFTSADGQRHYRVRIAQPQAAPPPAGYPVIYFLDGNAVLMELNAGLLAGLARQKQPPVLVMIGYDNNLRIDAKARSYDYTPATPSGSEEPKGGGADAFLGLIEDRIKPAVAAQVALDPRRQTLWGHSFGGLFALHALFTRPGAFQSYIAVEPSLWWGQGFILQEAQRFLAQRPALPVRLRLWTGGAERKSGAPAAPPTMRHSALPADATQQLANRLATLRGWRVNYREWPALGHGAMFGAAITPALDSVAKGE